MVPRVFGLDQEEMTLPMPRPLLLLIPLLVLLAGAGSGVEFQPPKDHEVGSAWSEEARWHSTGKTRIKLGLVKVRDKTHDEGISYFTDYSALSMVRGQADVFRLAFREASTWEGDEARDVGLAGVELESTGLGDSQRFERIGDGRLVRKARRFLDEHFSEGDPPPEEDDDEPDPNELMLPVGPVQPGDVWSLDMDEVERWAGPDDFQLDRELCTSRIELLEIVDRDGESVGRFAYDVLLVPSMVKDVEFTEARMAVHGTAEVPLSGAPELVSFDVEFAIRFVGRAEMRGVKADIDMLSSTTGTLRRTPLR